MDRQRVRQLAARFIAEAEADINYGLAEDLDPRHEYSVLVERLRRVEIPQPQRSTGPVGVGSEDAMKNHDNPESCEFQPLAELTIEL